jgi:hypothetical protein
MKFLVPNYSCLQNPLVGATAPQIPVLSVLCPQLNLLNPSQTIFLGMPQTSNITWIAPTRTRFRSYKWKVLLQRLHATRYVMLPTLWPIYGKSTRLKNLATLCALILVSSTKQISNGAELEFYTPESMLLAILHTFYVLPKLSYGLISYTNFNAQFLYSLTICMLHYDHRHVSSINMPIFRRTNCIITASGIVTRCKRLYSMPDESRLQRVTIPDAVIIQFVLLRMGMLMLETCRWS